MSRNSRDGVIIEMVVVGRYVKVSAIDTRTGEETSIVGDPAQGEEMLRRTAVRKLQYVMNKKAKEREAANKGRLV